MASCDRHRLADEIVAGARSYVGTRFRKQGRNRLGLDCIGLIIVSARAAGIAMQVPDWLPYRGLDADAVQGLFAENRCRQIPSWRSAEGDILLFWTAARQPHVALRGGPGVIEAHAGVGRVVERNLYETATDYSAWRLPE